MRPNLGALKIDYMLARIMQRFDGYGARSRPGGSGGNAGGGLYSHCRSQWKHSRRAQRLKPKLRSATEISTAKCAFPTRSLLLDAPPHRASIRASAIALD